MDSPPPGSDARRHLALMLALTFGTGVIDAVSFLALDQVFTANMTGNVAILAMGLTGAGGLPIVGPLIALGGFILGAATAGRALRGLAPGWPARSTALFGAVAGILLVTAVVTIVVPWSTPLSYAVVVCLSIAMGIQGGAARHLAISDVTSIVVTSTLVGIAFDSRLGHGTPGHPWVRRLAAIVLLGLGALAGALLQRLGVGWGVLAAALIATGVAIAGWRGAQR